MRNGAFLKIPGLLAALVLGLSCTGQQTKNPPTPAEGSKASKELILQVLGTAQDAGSPQMNCQKDCCKPLWGHPELHTPVVSLGITDHLLKKQYLFEATPDIREQWQDLSKELEPALTQPSGVFLTHAHMGHYIGLVHLGREAMGAKEVPVYGLPRMTAFIESQGPWNQLVRLNNIRLHTLTADSIQRLNDRLAVVPLQVPHRDEYSETAAFLIQGPSKTALFVPDIDKWKLWKRDLNTVLAQVDYAFIDATFFDTDELPGRNMDEIPHPFVLETLAKVESLPMEERKKIYLIHFNHTNPLLHADRPENAERVQQVERAGLNIARLGQRFSL